MAETPVGYFPDIRVQWTPQIARGHNTIVMRAKYSAREQRRGGMPTSGQRRWTANSDALEQEPRRIVDDFLNARRGMLDAFYFFNPIPQNYFNATSLAPLTPLGSVAAASRYILPCYAHSLTDVRVGGVPKTFTYRPLVPRAGSYVSLRFDGADDYIDCGSSSTLKVTGDCTYAAWVWLAQSSGANPWIVFSNEVVLASGTSLRIRGSDRKIEVETSQAGAAVAGASTGVVPAATWTHIAVVRSGTTVTFYINGIASGSATIAAPVTPTASFRVGLRPDNALPFDGLLSELRFYDTAVSAGEVANIYNGVATPSANLRGWWRLTEGTSTTAADSSGSSNTGTLTNTPLWVAGETEVIFTGSQTGAVSITGLLRERIIARSDSDLITQGFIPNAADVRAVFPLAILELIS